MQVCFYCIWLVTIQRDSPTRPANAVATNDSTTATNHTNQTVDNGWETPPASEYEPKRLQNSRILIPMSNNRAFWSVGLFQELPSRIPHPPMLQLFTTLLTGIINEFYFELSSPFGPDHDERAHRMLEANLH
jgi:hypothetical protein